MWGRCGRGGALLFLDDRCNLRPVLLAVQSSELSSSFSVLSNSLAVAHYIFWLPIKACRGSNFLLETTAALDLNPSSCRK